MQIIKLKNQLAESIKRLKDDGKSIAMVPTMGALHAGHMALVVEAKGRADAVIASIFVNPTQFGEGEDFGTYPRTQEQDIAKLDQHGVDIVYIPEVEEIYPEGIKQAAIELKYADILEGKSRPGFFAGVVTVVSKLFDHCSPDTAIFGEKDFQQLCMIKQLAELREDNINIIGVATMREDDGLALSSRNQYLSESEREIAPELHKALQMVTHGVGHKDAENYLLDMGFSSVDYIAVRDEFTFSEPTGEASRILGAATLGTTRLIDNITST